MRLSTVVLTVCAAAVLAACGTRERVVERDRPVVERQTVIERPVLAVGATAVPRGCTWESAAYSDGALSCQAGQQFRCSNGSWNRTLGSC